MPLFTWTPKSRMAVSVLAVIVWGGHPWVSALAACSALALLAGHHAHAQGVSPERVARIAEAMTVRIEGATQGSGVLVKREGNRYTVLTAWHVVSGQHLGEELDIYTPDGMRHPVEQGSIRRLGQVDLAVLRFASSSDYSLARITSKDTVPAGTPIFVAGFPLASSAVPTRVFRFLDGRVVAKTEAAMPDGYQLLYSSGLQPTMPGMSGGPILGVQGQLVGIHGRSETEDHKSQQDGIYVKTGTNLAIPIVAMNLPPSESLRTRAVPANTPTLTSRSQSPESPASMSSLGTIPNQGAGIPGSSFSPRNDKALEPLQKAVASGDLLAADKITKTLLLDSIGGVEMLSEPLTSSLNCQLLLSINEVWMSSSNNKFGLDAQSRLYANSLQDFEATVGWRVGGFLVSSRPNGAALPHGHFPRSIANGPIIKNLLARYRQCKARV
jgi:S1-C subfamily serine protease